MEKTIETQVLVIGGGATGTGIARDLTLRGVKVILIEKSDLNAGASGANHGLLHSGARYVHSDAEAAMECLAEGLLLKQIAPHCIEETGGLFVAVPGDDEGYIADFPSMCQRSGIHCQPLDLKEVRQMEPCLSPKLIAAFGVPDAAIDPFKLSIENLNDALNRGGQYYDHARLEAFIVEHHRIVGARILNTNTRELFRIRADIYVSATGAWADDVAARAGVHIPMVYSKGSLLVTGRRMATRVINRLRHPGNGDILMPGGVVSILGTTSVRMDSPDNLFPSVDEVDLIIDQGEQMIPALGHRRYIRAYSGVRPLVSAGGGEDRTVSRGFSLLDHAGDGVDNFITITGGKLTTFRLMAEKTSNRVCDKLGISAACQTRDLILPKTAGGGWTEPGVALGQKFFSRSKGDPLLCECEMVPASAIDAIISSIRKNWAEPDLLAIALRSRMGKGPCQGSFCSVRVLSHLYNQGEVAGPKGGDGLRRFLNERWKGEHALLWGTALAQSSLKEMIHCGLFCLEMEPPYQTGETPAEPPGGQR
ncbi:GlpA1 [Desulforapulum autotrophicum HRM2]|uniref:Glycerol-3-phosphate dehydrogenase n=1 Tax=Desulforapulum autotrophicum (strain ATCC 43914 / DSM 3382 / VKM B-1955 / HRM2) TaxID=177437 RepID=C0QGG9_DESAH|nr:anaerobic glycerol-3-phosphate dehydrogenase subunit A [Desulforapulum autotrophicum]ACN13444.1 GlpA1 [Desulforapulum autotrophicum HRM2]